MLDVNSPEPLKSPVMNDSRAACDTVDTMYPQKSVMMPGGWKSPELWDPMGLIEMDMSHSDV